MRKLRLIASILRRDERGAMAIIGGLLCTILIPMMALAIDSGYMYNAQTALQNSTDAAALAGGQYINCCTTGGTAVSKANAYSAASGDQNARSNFPVTMVAGYPQLKCLTSTGIPCAGPDNANAIVVKQQTTLSLVFGRFVGMPTITLNATSTASAKGGGMPPLNVIIVLDTTASMNDSDSSCSATRLTCALTGVRTLLGELWPSVDQVGLMIFPGLLNVAQAPLEYDCLLSLLPTIVSYASSPAYQVVGLSSDYKTSNTSALNTNSNLVKAVKGGGSGCSAGLSAVGGFGTYYADAITAAQTALVASSKPHSQNVIIFVSDGDASATATAVCPLTNLNCSKKSNQCHAGITAAQAAASAGTWVYSIAYGASTSSTGSCSTDSPHISACSTMQQIASSAGRFYSDVSGGSSSCTSTANSVSALTSIFQAVGYSLTVTRLLPNNAT